MLKNYPFYVKSTIVLMGLTLAVFALFTLKDILIPLAFAVLLAILLNPVVKWLMNKKIKKGLAISIAVVFAFFAMAALIYFLSSQIASFGKQLPQLKEKFQQLFSTFQASIAQDLNIPVAQQDQYIGEAKQSLKPLLGHTLGTLLGSLSIVFLLPVYTFLLLYYKTLILNFLFEIFSEKNSKEVGDVLNHVKGAIQNYMSGLLLEALMVATMNFIMLWILGIKYALLLAVLGALLNVLPYIGGIIAISLPLAIATLTKNGFETQLLIIGGFLIIQFIDNNFIMPVIVSSKVQINALVSIVVVLLGAAVWGVSGMFLSIPFIGVLKLIFDRVPELKPWGRLLGDQVPIRHRGEVWRKIARRVPVKKKEAGK